MNVLLTIYWFSSEFYCYWWRWY